MCMLHFNLVFTEAEKAVRLIKKCGWLFLNITNDIHWF